MNLLQRYIFFIFGLFFVALGICLIIKGGLGTSPISSLPYVLNLQFALSLGTFTFLVNMAMLVGQILILRRQFEYMQILQIPMTILFSLFIDFIMLLLAFATVETYPLKFCITLLGCLSLGFGVALEIIGNVVMLPGEGIVNAVATHWKIGLGKVKTAMDCALVIFAALLSLLYFQTVEGVREGTLISALLTGAIARFFIHHLSQVMQTEIFFTLRKKSK